MAGTTTPRPDLDAHRTVARMDTRVVVKELRNLLGAKLVAYIGGVGETRAVAGWIDGTRGIKDVTEKRLRTALHVALLLANQDSPRVAQAWFQGLNPQLRDRAPASALRDEDIDVAGPEVIEAARAFVVGG